MLTRPFPQGTPCIFSGYPGRIRETMRDVSTTGRRRIFAASPHVSAFVVSVETERSSRNETAFPKYIDFATRSTEKRSSIDRFVSHPHFYVLAGYIYIYTVDTYRKHRNRGNHPRDIPFDSVRWWKVCKIGGLVCKGCSSGSGAYERCRWQRSGGRGGSQARTGGQGGRLLPVG